MEELVSFTIAAALLLSIAQPFDTDEFPKSPFTVTTNPLGERRFSRSPTKPSPEHPLDILVNVCIWFHGSSTNMNIITDQVAISVDSFLNEHGIRPAPQTPIGFSFPFTVQRTNINRATLVTWGKGLNLRDGPGLEVNELLEAAFVRRGLDLKCGAIVNDVSIFMFLTGELKD